MISKRSLFRQACLIVLVLSHTTAFGEGWIEGGFEKAEQRASEQKVGILLHFYADWCGPCQRMEGEVFSSPEVATALSRGLVAVKVNSDQRRDLVGRYGVTSLPTDVYIAPSGAISNFLGASSKAGFLQRLASLETQVEVVSVVAAKPTFKQSTTPELIDPTDADATVSTQPTNEDLASGNSVVSKSEPSVTVMQQTSSESQEEALLHDQPETTTAASTTRSSLTRVENKRLGIGGFCPVSLSKTSAWSQGRAELSHEYQGVCYRFSSEADRDRFRDSPETYVPVLHGCDPVAFVKERRIESGVIELGTRYQDRLFFFASESNRQEFHNNPKRFTRSMDLTFFQAENVIP